MARLASSPDHFRLETAALAVGPLEAIEELVGRQLGPGPAVCGNLGHHMTRSGFAAHAPPYAVDHGRPGTAIAASIESDAVVIDVVAPTVLPGLVAALGGYTLLRPLFEHVRTSHGERQPVFAGYAALTPEGGLEPLTDGALAISD